MFQGSKNKIEKNVSDVTKLIVNLNERSYPVYIGEELLASPIWHSHIANQQVFIVTNESLAPLFLDKVKQGLIQFECDSIILPDGEQFKTLDTLSLVFDALIEKGHRRNTTLIALGGGVIGDLTGFAAACYQRGVNFIPFPTSLLSQVDASIGGKTAVNHPLGKNMIGAFYQPRAVVIDTQTLNTLPEREFLSGLAEVIKAALIADEDFFCWLETNISKMIQKDPGALHHAIKQSIAIKMKIVTADEREANVRAVLNLGHTFAHALEKTEGYGLWLHGEAVAVGLILAVDLSVQLGYLESAILTRVKNILTMAKLPIRLPSSVNVSQLIQAMHLDKKKESANLTFILLKGMGQPIISSHVNHELLETVLATHQG
jgi:3-dehydroquinate synthase